MDFITNIHGKIVPHDGGRGFCGTVKLNGRWAGPPPASCAAARFGPDLTRLSLLSRGSQVRFLPRLPFSPLFTVSVLPMCFPKRQRNLSANPELHRLTRRR
jgi:hypothetical protein